MRPLPGDGAGSGLPPEELAARLASRLCHDLIGPANAILLGLDLAAEAGGAEMRREALDAATAGARKLLDQLAFFRAAFGLGAEVFDAARLKSLAQGAFADLRPQLEWAVEAPALDAAAGRGLLNLVQIAAGAVASGGVVRVRAGLREARMIVTIDAIGPRAELHPEVLAGLMGEPFGEGLSGRWAQARYLHALLGAAGGSVAARATPAGVLFEAILPAGQAPPRGGHQAGDAPGS